MRTEPVDEHPPHRVRVPSMCQVWDHVSFLHWRTDPNRVRPLVPPELEIDTFGGSAWIGLILCRMNMRFPIGPSIPGLSTYPETNVRTYVIDGRGRRGLWFFSLDVPKVAAVVAARVGFNLPYVWSSMSIDHGDPAITYTARRRFDGTGSQCVVTSASGGISTGSDPLATFLTARFRLYGRGPLGLYSIHMEHPPWILDRAVAERVDDEFVPEAGLNVFGHPDHVCSSPGVDVRVGWPSLLPRRPRAR